MGNTGSGRALATGGWMRPPFSPSSVLITNSILWNGGSEIDQGDDSIVTVTFSDVASGWSGPGNDNIDADPEFVDPLGPDGQEQTGDENYRLLSGSPCINAGDPQLIAEPQLTDLDGRSRVLCDRIDMGAYEFGIGDFDCNTRVELADFAYWDACMVGPGIEPDGIGCEAFDFEFDGDVDLDDFADFALRLISPRK